jgi:uncharacterized protein (DUF2147 family)
MKSACLSIFLLVFFLVSSSFNLARPAYQLIGVWESEEKNLQIEMFENGGKFFGRMIYFKCSTDEMMGSLKDIENPDKDLTDRNLLGLMLVTELVYQGDNVWGNGKIYDPNSGHTFEVLIQLTSSRSANVRGYWKYRWIGRSMVFHRR